MKKLGDLNLRDNTLVLFISDHGSLIHIAKELETAIVASAAPAASGGEAPAEAEAPKEEKKEAAAEGLSALFG